MKSFLCTLLLPVIFQTYSSAQPQLALEPVVTGFSKPAKVTKANDSRLFVAEIGGKVKIVKNGLILPEPFLDISSKISEPNFAGIFSIVFPPDYQLSSYFYVMYVVSGKTEVRVSRFSRSAVSADLADPASEVEILTIPYGDVIGGHRGGDMAFGKDGHLYISTGDNGPGSRGVLGDPDNNAQHMGKLFGKLLRLDMSKPSPAAEPLSKIFALGLRNPWRFSFDRKTGDLWLGDNGQDGWEEVDFLQYPFGNAIPNFGWNCMEGSQPYDQSHCAPGTSYIAPRLTYPGFSNNGGKDASVMGGYVYRGASYPSLAGYYFFGDYATGKIGYIGPSGTAVPDAGLTCPSVISFGEDLTGELYALSFSDGTLFRITSTDSPSVRLLFFKLSRNERGFQLQWKTSFEQHFSHFEMQRSRDGQTFETLESVAAAGAGSDYAYLDRVPLSDGNHYRLKMTDVGGRHQYSNLVSVNSDFRSNAFVFPNPGASVITIGGLAKGDEVRIYNGSGLLIFTQNITSGDSWKVNMENKPKGVYTVFIDNPLIGFSQKLKMGHK